MRLTPPGTVKPTFVALRLIDVDAHVTLSDVTMMEPDESDIVDPDDNVTASTEVTVNADDDMETLDALTSTTPLIRASTVDAFTATRAPFNVNASEASVVSCTVWTPKSSASIYAIDTFVRYRPRDEYVFSMPLIAYEISLGVVATNVSLDPIRVVSD